MSTLLKWAFYPVVLLVGTRWHNTIFCRPSLPGYQTTLPKPIEGKMPVSPCAHNITYLWAGSVELYHMVKLLSILKRSSWVWTIPWRRKWQSTPALLPGKSHGRRSLIGYSPWGRKESDTTERLHFHFHFHLYLKD